MPGPDKRCPVDVTATQCSIPETVMAGSVPVSLTGARIVTQKVIELSLTAHDKGKVCGRQAKPPIELLCIGRRDQHQCH